MSDTHIVARDQLRSFIERIERLEAEKQTIADDIKDVYGEAKGSGFDTKILRKVISIRKMDRDERAEQEAILDTYLAALGMIPQPDLFDDEPHDAETGELSPKLAHTIVTGLQTETGRVALLTAVDIMIEREEAEERRSDGGLDIVTKHTEIASAPQGEAEDHSDQRETDREAAATGVGANEGGNDVDSSAARAGPEGPSSIEPTGPVAERATSLAREFGLNVESEMTDGHDQDEAEDGVVYEDVPPRPMKSLGYASCFPELSHAQYQRLSDSIASNGVNVPIVRMGDVIVDGWSRYNICRTLGIEYPVIQYRGNDVLLDVIAWQREAHQFTPSQERQIAGRLAKEIPHRAADIMAAFSLTEAAEKEMA